MKTKDFIKILQEEDPTGKAHIRLPGGPPIRAELKQGYYDGPYSYIEKGVYHVTDKNWKVDIYCSDMEKFIWDNKGDISKIKYDLNSKDRVERLKKRALEIKQDYDNFTEQQNEKFLCRVLARLKDGWKIVQSDDQPVGRYHVMWFVKNIDKFKDPPKGSIRNDTKNQKKLCQGECGIVLKSGYFKEERIRNIIYWNFSLR